MASLPNVVTPLFKRLRNLLVRFNWLEQQGLKHATEPLVLKPPTVQTLPKALECCKDEGVLQLLRSLPEELQQLFLDLEGWLRLAREYGPEGMQLFIARGATLWVSKAFSRCGPGVNGPACRRLRDMRTVLLLLLSSAADFTAPLHINPTQAAELYCSSERLRHKKGAIQLAHSHGCDEVLFGLLVAVSTPALFAAVAEAERTVNSADGSSEAARSPSPGTARTGSPISSSSSSSYGSRSPDASSNSGSTLEELVPYLLRKVVGSKFWDGQLILVLEALPSATACGEAGHLVEVYLEDVAALPYHQLPLAEGVAQRHINDVVQFFPTSTGGFLDSTRHMLMGAAATASSGRGFGHGGTVPLPAQPDNSTHIQECAVEHCATCIECLQHGQELPPVPDGLRSLLCCYDHLIFVPAAPAATAADGAPAPASTPPPPAAAASSLSGRVEGQPSPGMQRLADVLDRNSPGRSVASPGASADMAALAGMFLCLHLDLMGEGSGAPIVNRTVDAVLHSRGGSSWGRAGAAVGSRSSRTRAGAAAGSSSSGHAAATGLSGVSRTISFSVEGAHSPPAAAPPAAIPPAAPGAAADDVEMRDAGAASPDQMQWAAGGSSEPFVTPAMPAAAKADTSSVSTQVHGGTLQPVPEAQQAAGGSMEDAVLEALAEDWEVRLRQSDIVKQQEQLRQEMAQGNKEPIAVTVSAIFQHHQLPKVLFIKYGSIMDFVATRPNLHYVAAAKPYVEVL